MDGCVFLCYIKLDTNIGFDTFVTIQGTKVSKVELRKGRGILC